MTANGIDLRMYFRTWQRRVDQQRFATSGGAPALCYAATSWVRSMDLKAQCGLGTLRPTVTLWAVGQLARILGPPLLLLLLLPLLSVY